jgi:hypothetical protein
MKKTRKKLLGPKEAERWLRDACDRCAAEWHRLHQRNPKLELFLYAKPGILKVKAHDPESLAPSIKLSPSLNQAERAEFIFGVARFVRCLPDGSSLH